MIVVRDSTPQQIARLEESLLLDELQANSVGCKGECWDCDSCGGSATH